MSLTRHRLNMNYLGNHEAFILQQPIVQRRPIEHRPGGSSKHRPLCCLVNETEKIN